MWDQLARPKNEWALYLRMRNEIISEERYTQEINNLNPPLENGPAENLKDIFEQIFGLIR